MEKYIEYTINDLQWKSLSDLKRMAFERWQNCQTIEGRVREQVTMQKLEKAMQEIEEKYRYEQSVRLFQELRGRF